MTASNPPNESQRDEASTTPDTPRFNVVGVVASAGGIASVREFLHSLPDASEFIFVFIAEPDADGPAIDSSLLADATGMPVVPVSDGLRIQPNHVYVMESSHYVICLDDRLVLRDVDRQQELVGRADNFLTSLADSNGDHAIAVILDGNGLDGADGVKSIKRAGGLTVVQSPETCKYRELPSRAIATGMVDYVRSANRIVDILVRFRSEDFETGTPSKYQSFEYISNMPKVHAELRQQTGHDFTSYKHNSICRRVDRRMAALGLTELSDYVEALQENAEEAELLFGELLIGVTSFFRDPAVFDALRDALLKLLQTKPTGSAVRVWVAGCSTGEEAYSIAITIKECMDALDRQFPVQIFATDIDNSAVEIARNGCYSSKIAKEISEARLERFFTKTQDSYCVKKSIREMLVFASHDIVKDPPFTKLDLLSCRNMLIYFRHDLQRRLLSVFHYSLAANGLLILGTSETTGQMSSQFRAIDKSRRLYRPVTNTDSTPLMPIHYSRTESSIRIRERDRIPDAQRVVEYTQAILDTTNAPPCAVIDDVAQIIFLHGNVSKHLVFPEGRISLNILDLVRPSLRSNLATAIHNVIVDRREVTCDPVRLQIGECESLVQIIVRPIVSSTVSSGLMIVCFDESKAPDDDSPDVSRKSPGKTIVELELELQLAQESHQTLVEQLRASNEELRLTNEELQSTNEEMQSTNEELETTKEELQSLNEEAATVNLELQSRINELSKTNDDMKNLLDSTEIATIFLDSDLRIRNFTPRAVDLVRLNPSDRNRPIGDQATRLIEKLDLQEFASRVLTDLIVLERKVTTEDDNTYLLRARPYRTLNNVIDGVVLTFVNITKLRELPTQNRD